MTESDPAMADLVARLDDSRREFYEERAAIREFDGGLPRAQAECLALLDVLTLHPMALAGLTVLRVGQGSAIRYVLTNDRQGAINRLTAMGCSVAEGPDVTELLLAFGGLAVLSQVDR